MCPKYVEENGRVFYFAMSRYLPVCNIVWMRAEMPEMQSAYNGQNRLVCFSA